MPVIAQSPDATTSERVHALPPLWVLIFAAWLIPALLSGFDTYMQGRLDGRPPEWRWVVFNSIDWLLYAVLTPIVFRLSRRFPIERPHLARHIAVHVAGALGMCVAWAALGTLLRLGIFPIPPDLTATKWVVAFASWVFTTLPFGVGVYFALVGIEHSFFYFAQARARETQAARLAAQLSEARLGALRMQLNPHFLFNSLNAITVLVRDRNTAAASRMLELLSDVLRQVLDSEPGSRDHAICGGSVPGKLSRDRAGPLLRPASSAHRNRSCGFRSGRARFHSSAVGGECAAPWNRAPRWCGRASGDRPPRRVATGSDCAR